MNLAQIYIGGGLVGLLLGLAVLGLIVWMIVNFIPSMGIVIL